MMTDTPMQLAQEAHQLHAEQRDEEALACLNKALALEPTLTGALFLKGIVALSHGDYRTGWPLFELRHQRLDAHIYGTRHQAKPMWDGSPTDKKVLIWAAEGLGDTVQMLRFMPEAVKRCSNLQLELQYPLVRLAKTNGFAADTFAVGDREPEFDLQCSLLSLPLVLRKRLEDIRGDAYIKAGEVLIKDWKLRKPDHLKLGICWAGNPDNSRDAVRSIRQGLIAPIANQYDFIAVSREHTAFDDVADLAGLIENLDIVVTVDTLTAHIAGAMGKPTYLMVGVDCDWRWLQQRSDSPWYQSVKIFRQRKAGDWATVIDEVIAKLRETHAKTFTIRGPGAEPGGDEQSRDGAVSSVARAHAA